MPYSLGFVVRIFRKDKVGGMGVPNRRFSHLHTSPLFLQVYQGVCVQQETSARAALPRSRFSRVVTGPAFGEHRVGVDR